MTAEELTIIKAVRDVTVSAASLMSSYKTLRRIRKQDAAQLDERILIAKKVCIARGAGEIFCVNLEELARAQKEIESFNFSPEFQELAMQQLNALNYILLQNLEDYKKNHGA